MKRILLISFALLTSCAPTSDEEASKRISTLSESMAADYEAQQEAREAARIQKSRTCGTPEAVDRALETIEKHAREHALNLQEFAIIRTNPFSTVIMGCDYVAELSFGIRDEKDPRSFQTSAEYLITVSHDMDRFIITRMVTTDQTYIFPGSEDELYETDILDARQPAKQ